MLRGGGRGEGEEGGRGREGGEGGGRGRGAGERGRVRESRVQYRAEYRQGAN